MLELTFQTFLQEAFCKKPLENPQKLPTERATLFWRKLLRFQRTFLEKSFVSGFGRIAPTDNAHNKKHGNAVFFIYPKYNVYLKPPIKYVGIPICKYRHIITFYLAFFCGYMMNWDLQSFSNRGLRGRAP